MDKRVQKTREAAKEALLELLKSSSLSDVTVSSLCLQAGISRSTFYCNFQNVSDVFTLLISDFIGETRTLKTQLRCSSCQEASADGKVPYCVAVRTAGKYRDVVRQSGFLAALLDAPDSGFVELSVAPYLDLGVSPEVARSLLVFQMSGCHAAALSGVGDRAWADHQQAIDAFIAGGMRAVGQLQRR